MTANADSTEQPAFLSDLCVAIIGLGLMGGSLAMALQGKCRLIAADPDPATVALARQRGLVERVETEPRLILPEADLIILAAPVQGILDIIPQLPELHPGSPVVLDLGSTKAHICQALTSLPGRFTALGGHPMCGKETSGLINADPALYQGATFALVELPLTSTRARRLALQLVEAVGAIPFWIDALTHDRWVATTSHLPYLVSTALALSVPEAAAPLTGPGFRSTTRLAGSASHMMKQVLLDNREFIQPAITAFQDELVRLQEALVSASPDLGGLLEAAAHKRTILLRQGESA